MFRCGWGYIFRDWQNSTGGVREENAEQLQFTAIQKFEAPLRFCAMAESADVGTALRAGNGGRASKARAGDGRSRAKASARRPGSRVRELSQRYLRKIQTNADGTGERHCERWPHRGRLHSYGVGDSVQDFSTQRPGVVEL